MVACVEYDPWADELRLCTGEGGLRSPSAVDGAAAETVTLSPLPLSRLGLLGNTAGSGADLAGLFNPFGFPLSALLIEVVGVVEPFEVDLKESRFEVTRGGPREGREFSFPMREADLGGCGKAAILTDLLTTLTSAVLITLDMSLIVGTFGDD